MVVLGETANLSCTTTSDLPVDWYFQRRGDDASPRPLFANDVVLDARYDVVTSAGRCPDSEGAVLDDRVCRSYDLVVVNFRLDDVGLYTCCEHGNDLDDALCTFRLAITGWPCTVDLIYPVGD